MGKRCEECGQIIQVEKYEIDNKTTKTVLSCACRVMGVICRPDIPVEIPWGKVATIENSIIPLPCYGEDCFYRKFFDKHDGCKCEESKDDDDDDAVLVYKDAIEDFLERARELRDMADGFIEDFEEILEDDGVESEDGGEYDPTEDGE